MPPRQDILDQLIALEPIKTWSLIVTLFGDLEGERLSGKHIGALLGPIGTKPEAMRVALHRLRKDGWITSEKTGREMSYGLSTRARAETEAVRQDVYGLTPKFPGGWTIQLSTSEAAAPSTTSIRIARNIDLVWSGMPGPDKTALVVVPVAEHLPAWFEDRVLSAAARRTAASLTQISRDAPHDSPTRLLILHLWRKLALRPETWAHIGLRPEGEAAQCHRAVTSWLAQGNPLSDREINVTD